MWLIVGLGNPGRKYHFNRHNIGFLVIGRLSRNLSIPMNKTGMVAKRGKGRWEDQDVVFAKPQTFMNLSGEAVAKLSNFFRIETNKLIIIHDDLDLDFGQIRVKEQGGDGGHKGVGSIIESLGTDVFIRVRMGISRPEHTGEGKNYVLSDFDEQQGKRLGLLLEQAEEAVKTIILEGTAVAMNRFNRKNVGGL